MERGRGCPGFIGSQPPGRSDNGPSGQYDPRARSFALTCSQEREGEENRREPEGNAACGKALSDAEIATVERREARHPVARGAERLTSARVPVIARTAGCSRGTRAPPALRRPLRGRTRCNANRAQGGT